MGLPKEFKFRIPVRSDGMIFTATYTDILEQGDNTERGKRGYHVMANGYLLKDVEMCINEGIWVIIDEKNEKEKK